jgi:hypothetical protein
MVEVTNKRGKYEREELKVRDFLTHRLTLSDLKLTPRVSFLGMDAQSGEEVFNVMPYPFDYISLSHPAYVYFEIYNLGVSPGENTDYEVSLKIERRLEKGEYVLEAVRSLGRIFSGGSSQEIETSYQRQGNSQTSKEYIELDLTGIPTGHNRLTVTVHDLVMNSEAEESTEFELTDRH